MTDLRRWAARPGIRPADPRIIPLFGERDAFPDYDRSSLYRTEAESDRIEQLVRLVRKEMWQDRVKWFCVVVAVFAAVYFTVEMFR